MLCACGGERPAAPVGGTALRAPVFDAEFRRQWDDGAAEVSSYETVRLRDGALRKGTATVIVRRATYSEDERVPVENGKAAPADGFPAMQMLWIERYAEGLENREEMTTSVVALQSVDGRVPGSATKADFSFHGWDGQLFHQLLLDATGVRSHQYSFFESEGDEQITLAYPRNGIAGDALWFWARGVAAPALTPGEQQDVVLLNRLRDARLQHHTLAWKGAALSRSGEHAVRNGRVVDSYAVRKEDGSSELFVVEAAAPFRVLHWEESRGERADFLSANRLKSWTGLVPMVHSLPNK